VLSNAALANGIDPSLLAAVAVRETGFLDVNEVGGTKVGVGVSLAKMEKRSKTSQRGAESNGKACRSCWTIHRLVECLVTLKCAEYAADHDY
jgi:hypothetical protein